MSSLTARLTARRPSPAAKTARAMPGRRIAARLFDCLTEWHRRSRSRAEMTGFTPHMLRDIGITPSECERECNKPFWRR